ncbi:unnamed protein product [Phytophthora fragariaefolia]|uniref:Unnamed protein product n=1 Tax=Phytophthora fragariaefolia TaxID=1490495 RepID=A0A9W6TPK4_9STRA|nr:unnamed protein product [Phytophthora fragariaefolia]
MAPPSTSVGVGGDSPLRPPPAGVAEASAPSPPTTASTGDASGASSEPSLARPVDALSPVLGAASRSATDAPEAALGADSADSQTQGSVSSSGASGDGTRSSANAPEASSVPLGASRFSSVRWEDIEDIVTTGTDRTVRQVQESTQNHFLPLARLVVDLNRRPSLRTDYELDQRLEAAGSLSDSSQAAAVIEQRCHRLDKSLADTHRVIRHDRGQCKAGISSYAAQLRLLREYLEQSDRHSSVSGGASSASASAMPAAFATFLEELGALRLAIPPPPAASGSSEGSGLAPPASSGSLDETAAKSGSSTSLTVDSDDSDDTGPIVPFALHKGKGKRPAKSSAKLQSPPPTPKKKQRLGRPSVDLKARKAATQAASAVVSSSGPHQSVPSSLPAASPSTSSAPIAGIAVSADSDVLSFASIPSGSYPPFSPAPRTPASPASSASSTASTASLPSTPVVSRGITPGTEASVPVEINDDGGFGTDGAASEASVAPGRVFSSPVVSQPRRDGRPTRAASTTAGLRSMVAAEIEAAPDALVLGLATPLRMPAATQPSVASPASVPDPAESAAVHTATKANWMHDPIMLLYKRSAQSLVVGKPHHMGLLGSVKVLQNRSISNFHLKRCETSFSSGQVSTGPKVLIAHLIEGCTVDREVLDKPTIIIQCAEEACTPFFVFGNESSVIALSFFASARNPFCETAWDKKSTVGCTNILLVKLTLIRHSSKRLNNRSNVSRQESNDSPPKQKSSTNDLRPKIGTSEVWSASPLMNMSPRGSFTTAERESGISELSRSALNRVRPWVAVSVGEPPTAVSAASAIRTRSAKADQPPRG